MEGIYFRETPEQARRSQQMRISTKIRTMEQLSDYDYEFMRAQEDNAIESLRAKIAL